MYFRIPFYISMIIAPKFCDYELNYIYVVKKQSVHLLQIFHMQSDINMENIIGLVTLNDIILWGHQMSILSCVI